MHFTDYAVIAIYFAALAVICYRSSSKNESVEDYFVGGRKMKPLHVGLSVAATDVGGGFSIGLAGLGFVMGISASWLLFTGLIGALLSAWWMIPQIKKLQNQHPGLLTYPDLLSKFFDRRVVTLSALISFMGYVGFTASQLLAGAKLTSAVVPEWTLLTSLAVVTLITILYTAIGGLRAVVATDSFQWCVLFGGLLFVALPLAWVKLGGWVQISNSLPANFFSFTNIEAVKFLNWTITIIPIWFVAMTLYQRIYSLESKSSAQKAWLIAGVFEWPIMAFVGALLGVLARAAMEQGIFPGGTDVESNVPLFLRAILPSGLLGLILVSYLSAVLSTADSCLLAASGNLVKDLMGNRSRIRLSQFLTAVTGVLAFLLATSFDQVLDLMLHSYSFMVAGLFVPTIFALCSIKSGKRLSSRAALASIIVGGSLSIFLGTQKSFSLYLGLDPIVFGLTASWAVFVAVNQLDKRESTAR